VILFDKVVLNSCHFVTEFELWPLSNSIQKYTEALQEICDVTAHLAASLFTTAIYKRDVFSWPWWQPGGCGHCIICQWHISSIFFTAAAAIALLGKIPEICTTPFRNGPHLPTTQCACADFMDFAMQRNVYKYVLLFCSFCFVYMYLKINKICNKKKSYYSTSSTQSSLLLSVKWCVAVSCLKTTLGIRLLLILKNIQ
jgi:hypothetical protein